MARKGKPSVATRGVVRYDVDLARYSSLGIGGPADIMVYPRDIDDLADLLRQLGDSPLYVLGEGTNCLFPDSGFRGVVVNVRRAFLHLRIEGRRVTAGASIKLDRLIGLALNKGLGGLEPLAGIPGSVGGGVMMNAGAYGMSLGDVVRRIKAVRRDGSVTDVGRDEMVREYRRPLIDFPAVVVEAEFELSPVDVRQSRRRVREIKRERKGKHPIEFPNAGSIFKNPPGGTAARLIEAAGLKGRSVGGAQVSTRHANFIINTSGARAGDVTRLIELIRERVMETSGVRLEPEIRIVKQI